MFNTTKVKTWQPIIPDGKGPIIENAEEAVLEILCDIRERMTDNSTPSDDELQSAVQLLVNGLGISDWIDGEYSLFDDYKIKVHTYQQGQLDAMPEFNGY